MMMDKGVITEWGNTMLSKTDAYYECKDQNIEVVNEL